MVQRGVGGRVINIASALGKAGAGNGQLAYCASKFGVIGLTQAIADETRESGLYIYAILPWAVNTTLLKDSDLDLDPSEVLAPEYVASKIFEAARGKKKSGTFFEVYS